MPVWRGIDLRAGFEREAVVTEPTWPGTAAALTALLPLLDIQPNDGAHHMGITGSDSGLGVSGFDLLDLSPTVSATWKLRYQGFEQLLACALGHGAKRLDAVEMPEVLATGAYRHLYELDAGLSTANAWVEDDDGFEPGELTDGQRKTRYGTLALSSQVSVWEWLSAMVQACTLTIQPGTVTLTVEFLSHSLSRASSVNTITTMRTLQPITAPAAHFADWTWQIGAYSASVALDEEAIVPCRTWSLRLDNGLASGSGPRTDYAPEEPERQDVPRATVTFVVPRHEADTWQERWAASDRLMAIGSLIGPEIGSTGFNYAVNIYLPSCQVTNAQVNSSRANLPPDTVQIVAVIPETQAAGFPTMQRLTPLAIELVSGNPNHALL